MCMQMPYSAWKMASTLPKYTLNLKFYEYHLQGPNEKERILKNISIVTFTIIPNLCYLF